MATRRETTESSAAPDMRFSRSICFPTRPGEPARSVSEGSKPGISWITYSAWSGASRDRVLDSCSVRWSLGCFLGSGALRSRRNPVSECVRQTDTYCSMAFSPERWGPCRQRAVPRSRSPCGRAPLPVQHGLQLPAPVAAAVSRMAARLGERPIGSSNLRARRGACFNPAAARMLAPSIPAPRIVRGAGSGQAVKHAPGGSVRPVEYIVFAALELPQRGIHDISDRLGAADAVVATEPDDVEACIANATIRLAVAVPRPQKF